MQSEPLFLKNKDWYVTPEDDRFFPDGRGYHLAPGAPQEAIDSYNVFYNPVFYDDDGNPLDDDGMAVNA